MHGPATYKKKKTSGSVGPRSLNISIRRRENERIERENHAFAKRLFQNHGSISKQRLDQHFNQQMELRGRISRVKKPLPNLGGRANALPPIDHNTFNRASKRSFSVKQGQQTSQANGRSSVTKGMFSTNPQLNQQSTGQIPISSMYENQQERDAMVPPVKEGLAHEEAIKETLSEQQIESGYKDRTEQQRHYSGLPKDESEEEQAPATGAAAAEP